MAVDRKESNDILWSVNGDNYHLECIKVAEIKRAAPPHRFRGWIELDASLDMGSVISLDGYMDKKVTGEARVMQIERRGAKHRHTLSAGHGEICQTSE